VSTPRAPSASPAPAKAAPPRERSDEAGSSWLARLRDRDHTREGILGSLVVLALPSVLMGIFGGGLFQMFELRFLGELGADAVAAAGASNQILRQVVFLMTFGVTIAAQMWIAQQVGAGRVEAAEHAAGQSFLIGGVLSGIAAVAGGVFAEPLVAWVTGDPEVAALGVPYVRITFLTFSLFVASQVFGAVLLGAGDSTTPLLVNLVTTPVGIVAQWALAFGKLGMPALGISGIAWGAAMGGLSGLGISAWALLSGRCRVHLRRRHLRWDSAGVLRLLSLSWQPALHFLARSLIIMVFMWLAGRLGGAVQAAYTIGLRVEMLAIMVAFPLANACATLVGQNLGAGDVARAWRSIAVSSAVMAGILGPAAVAMNGFRFEIVGFFATDPAVTQASAGYLFYASLVLVLYGLYFVAFRTLQAAGDMNTPMWISLGTAVGVGVPMGAWLSADPELGATGMWVANAVYAALNAALMIGWMVRGRWARPAEA
jgi:putative MATE family efflux protein